MYDSRTFSANLGVFDDFYEFVIRDTAYPTRDGTIVRKHFTEWAGDNAMTVLLVLFV
jgi:hypothetical protein